MANELEIESITDPYTIFVYAMNSPITTNRYTTRLRRFFTFTGLEGTVQEQCKIFVDKSRRDSNWAYKNIINFLFMQKQRTDKKEFAGSTVRNYVKAIKLFTEMNDISFLGRRLCEAFQKAGSTQTNVRLRLKK